MSRSRISRMTRLSLLGSLLTAACLAAWAARAEPSDSTLADWQGIYWYWALGDPDDAGVTFKTDANGNAAVGNVVLMPIPNAPGDGTPGSINVSLNSGESFFLPLWALLGTSYTDGTPPDEFFGLNIFKTLDITLKIDGATVISAANVMDYYSKDEFDPAIPVEAFGIDSVIWFQGVSILHAPLSPGKHTITLDAKNTIPVPGLGTSEYHNTWNIRVVKVK